MKKLRNLGPASWRMLARANITNVETLRAMGAVAAFVHVQQCGGKATLNLFYAMAAGLKNKDILSLSATEKGILNADLENLRDLVAAKQRRPTNTQLPHKKSPES
jgi:DNA transformation protein